MSGRLYRLHHRHLCLTETPGLPKSARHSLASCWWPGSHTCMDLKWLRLVTEKSLRTQRSPR